MQTKRDNVVLETMLKCLTVPKQYNYVRHAGAQMDCYGAGGEFEMRMLMFTDNLLFQLLTSD